MHQKKTWQKSRIFPKKNISEPDLSRKMSPEICNIFFFFNQKINFGGNVRENGSQEWREIFVGVPSDHKRVLKLFFDFDFKIGKQATGRCRNYKNVGISAPKISLDFAFRSEKRVQEQKSDYKLFFVNVSSLCDNFMYKISPLATSENEPPSDRIKNFPPASSEPPPRGVKQKFEKY